MSFALIAGTGRLPELVTERRGGDVPVYALEGQAPELSVPVHTFRLETLGTQIGKLLADGVTEVCFAGIIHRPKIDPARIDAATAPMAARIASVLAQGDAGALKVITDLFEEAGLNVVGAHRLCPELLPPPGVPTKAQPLDRHAVDAARAAEVVGIIGAADIGQGCVVSHSQVLAIETLPGTDAMLASLRNREPHLPAGGLIYKSPKPGQDRRIDLPTIGASTMRNAAAAGLDGVVVEAGGVLVLDAAATIAEADRQGVFIWIREP